MLLTAAACLWPAAARGQVRYALGDTVALQRDWSVVTYRDLDNDGNPDLAVITGDRRRIEIYERRGDAFLAVAALSVPSTAFDYGAVGDVDGDGFPELALRGRRSGELYLIEASGDDRYRLTRFPVGPIDDATCIGDTDGDGRLEVIAAQAGFPSRVHRFEAVGDDRYERLPILEGAGGGVYLACAAGGQADPLRLVVADTHFWVGVLRGTWLEASGARGQWPRLGFFPTALGDTDDDGRAELVGYDPAGALVIADLADRLRPRIVVRDPGGSCAAMPDYDGDGRLGLLCAPRIDGVQRVLVRSRRGGRLVTIFDSGSLLPASRRAMRARPTGDWNGDGVPEILVTRGGPSPVLFVLMSAPR